jgi:hypothetical protein
MKLNENIYQIILNLWRQYLNILNQLEMYVVYESINKTEEEKKEKGYFSGTYIEERDAPIPGVPWRTGLLVIANSPR